MWLLLLKFYNVYMACLCPQFCPDAAAVLKLLILGVCSWISHYVSYFKDCALQGVYLLISNINKDVQFQKSKHYNTDCYSLRDTAFKIRFLRNDVMRISTLSNSVGSLLALSLYYCASSVTASVFCALCITTALNCSKVTFWVNYYIFNPIKPTLSY